ncbi:hypothetical protein BON22_5242 [Cyberlindnera fabianii]|uniref:Uncharacterized protein n=1 Tax=Cyberlindnera fabianii TaxID=36022 RepID=A0A1V2KZ78_CYBFA|nr:hypothetical protein BON22_5242 [Cyberlindnera fabianii]
MSTLEFDSSNPLVLKRRKADNESDSEPDELLVDDISNNRNKSKRRQRGGVNADEAKIAEDKRKQIEEDKLRAKAQDLSENSEELCNKLISMLEPLQSPMELLQNLAKAKPKKVIKGKKIKLSEEETKRTRNW